MKLFRRGVAAFVAVSLMFSSFAQAAPVQLIGTEQAAAPAAADAKTQLQSWAARQDLTAALQARGVSADELRARVDALTDAEAAQVLAQIDSAPAGGDVLGYRVRLVPAAADDRHPRLHEGFPFTRSIR